MNSHKTTPAGKTRGRGLKLPFPGAPGEHNAITDVAGVEVGVTTLISGAGKLVVGAGPVRTGVTAILPRGRGKAQVPCAAGSYALNGNGEMTGTIWIEESGELQTPITITNTHSCGIARDATIEWLVRHGGGNVQDWGLPVAAETYDGDLNDINGFHVKAEHVIQALEGARGGPVEQGSVGGGTGMICYDFKGGNGTASRVVKVAGRNHTVGAFVQSNFGQRPECTILGVPAGRHLTGDELRGKPAGSIIVVIATDAPLEAHQLKRIARRVPIGLARTGGIGHNSSGDIFLAFSTANEAAFTAKRGELRRMEAVGTGDIDPLFEATIEATEEAIIDSMIANETMEGRDGNRSVALPHDQLIDVMKKYGRM
ncbi:DmpA family aminopeptidase [Taklimakanibacter lacteus]|uniref:DmpA family aminopeptidase n=1 Tax=Taklimakanibacter lacteus TaxID=2268456 RepID=UPI000E6633C7